MSQQQPTRRLKKRRVPGWVAEWKPTKSGGWGVIRSGEERLFFHSRSLLNPEVAIKIGAQVVFSPLPPVRPGSMKRATEIEILPPKKGPARPDTTS